MHAPTMAHAKAGMYGSSMLGDIMLGILPVHVSGYACALLQRTDRTSMPNIWIQGQPIGGCNDGPGLLTLARKGELAPMLKAAGAL